MRELAERRANRIPASLKRRAGEEPYDEDSDRRAREQPWLSQVYAASVSWRVAMGPGQVRPGCRHSWNPTHLHGNRRKVAGELAARLDVIQIRQV